MLRILQPSVGLRLDPFESLVAYQPLENCYAAKEARPETASLRNNKFPPVDATTLPDVTNTTAPYISYFFAIPQRPDSGVVDLYVEGLCLALRLGKKNPYKEQGSPNGQCN